MRLKLSLFISLFLTRIFCGISINDLSSEIGSTLDQIYEYDECNYRLICWKDLASSNDKLNVAIWNGTAFVQSELTETGGVSAISTYNGCINSAGQGAVAWGEGLSPSVSINCSIYNTTSSTWSKTLLASDIYYVSGITLCESSSGNCVVIWIERDRSYQYIIKGAYWNGTSWSFSESLDSALSRIYNLSAYLDTNNVATIKWESKPDSSAYCSLKVATWTIED
jgi:hypothetical protein